MENPGQGKLLIFVGEKIEVTEMEQEKGSDIPNLKFKARYKVLKVVCGEHKEKEIEFIVFDNYGRPRFEKYDNVLLYITKEDSTFYHEKYLFDDVYKTKDGQWAGPYSADNYDRVDTSRSKIKPRKIEFDTALVFDLKGVSRNELQKRFPVPFFRIEGRRAIAAYGNYVGEIVELKKNGVLKARGFYGTEEDQVVKESDVSLTDIALVDNAVLSKADEYNLKMFFEKFTQAIAEKDSVFIRKNSLDSVYCSVCEGYTAEEFVERFRFENNLETVDTFLISAFRNLPKSILFEKMQKSNYKISAERYRVYYGKSEKADKGTAKEEIVYQISIIVPSDKGELKFNYTHTFEFVLRNGQYKFFGMKTEDNAWY